MRQSSSDLENNSAEQRERRHWAWMALFTGAAGIGFAPIFVRLSETGPSATASLRVFVALPLLWTWALVERRSSPVPPSPIRAQGKAIIIAGLLFTADLAIWHWSLRMTTIANSTLFSNLAPVFVALGAWYLFAERPTLFFLIGTVVAFAGATLLVSVSFQFGTSHLWGDILATVTAIFYAGYLLAVKHLRQHLSTARIMAWTGSVSAPAFMIVALLSGEKIIPATRNGWLAVIALGLISHVGGQTLIAFAFGRLPASSSALSLLLQPVVAAVLAWILFGEVLSPLQLCGAAITLGGLVIASRKRVTG